MNDEASQSNSRQGGFAHGLLEHFARWGARQPGRVLLVAGLATLLGCIALSQLRVDQDLKALLPSQHESVQRLERVTKRLGAQNDLIIELRSPSREANLRFGKALSEALEDFDELSWVSFHRPLDSFKRNALLYLPLPELLELRREVLKQLRKETEQRLDLGLNDSADSDDQPAEALEMEQRASSWVKQHLGFDELPSDYMEADEGRIVVVKARPVRGTAEVDFAAALIARVNAQITTLKPGSFHPELSARVRGDYVTAAGRASRLRGDILATVFFALGLVLAVIGLWFRQLRAIPIVVIPIVIATLVTMGIGAITEGSFNLVTTFIFAILLGLGTDFGIHCFARYSFERERGADLEAALRTALQTTGNALLTGASTTALVFFSLQVGEFQGFAQFGRVAGIGVVAALLATLGLVPALTALLEGMAPSRPKKPPKAPHTPGIGTGTSASGRKKAWAVLAVGLSLGLLSLASASSVGFEYEFSNLGPVKKPSGPKPAGPLAKASADYRTAVGKVTTFSPAVALCDDATDCEEITRLLEAISRAKSVDELLGKLPPRAPPSEEEEDEEWEDADSESPLTLLEREFETSAVSQSQRALIRPLGRERLEIMRHRFKAQLGLHTLVPGRQTDKLKVIADLRQQLQRKRGAMSASRRAELDRWAPYLDVNQAITAEDLPTWALREVREKDARLGHFVIIWNGGTKANYEISSDLKRGFFELPASDGSRIPVAANYFVLVEIVDSLRKDGPVVMSVATGLVLLCLCLMFRSLRTALLTLLPLAASVTWLVGLHAATGWKFNMFSIVALPLLVGIGIDNGVHIHHRWRECHSLPVVFREVGGPITLTMLTTLVGFVGLMMTGHRGIASLGRTAAIGMFLTYLGAVVLLPALLYLLPRAGAGPEPIQAASDEAETSDEAPV